MADELLHRHADVIGEQLRQCLPVRGAMQLPELARAQIANGAPEAVARPGVGFVCSKSEDCTTFVFVAVLVQILRATDSGPEGIAKR